MTDEVENPSIHVLMARALADLPAIGKNSTAPANMGGYKFRGIEDITAALKPIFGAHGIFVLPRTPERIATERKVGNNKTMYCIDVHVAFRFSGPNGDYVEADVWGQGTDMGDKATQKAYTSAFKSLLIIAYLIADEQDDAERHDVPDTGGTNTGPTPDEIAQAGGWADEAEKAAVHKGLAPGLRKLVDEGKLDEKTGKGLWAGIPKDGNSINLTKEQFNTWMDGVEQAKADYAASIEAATDQVKDATGAEEVETPTA